MSRLIDANRLKRVMAETLESLKKNPKMSLMEIHLICAFETVGKMVDAAPTVDAVQVVRCVDCSNSDVCKMDDGDVRYCHIYEMQTEDDYYCADGERKDDE